MRTLTFLGRAGFIVLVQTVSGAWAAPPTPPSAPMTDHLAQAIQISDGPISLTRTRRELGFREKMGPSGVSFVVDLAPLKAALERITIVTEPRHPCKASSAAQERSAGLSQESGCGFQHFLAGL